MYCVGLTGNIASGKSTVTAVFKSLGAGVINADNIAKQLTSKDQAAFILIKNHFGSEIINQAGELDRIAMRKLIFSDPKHRLWLENLLHPLIRDEIKRQLSLCKSPYCVIEIPLLKSKACYPYLDSILVLLADREKQIERIIQRDHCKKEDALRILATQPDEESRRNLATEIIINDGTIIQLTNKIKKLHDKYLHFANEKSSS